MLKITYYNEQGYKGECVLLLPDKIDHSWWSHSRGVDGKLLKHNVTVFEAFLRKLPKKFSIKQIKTVD